jgi:twitching motility two-component system response regulator PilG
MDTVSRSGNREMQGTLQEIDIRTLLKLVTTSQQTGYLLVRAKNKQWIIYFSGGQVTYGANCYHETARLLDYLHRYRGDMDDSLDNLNLPVKQFDNQFTSDAYQYLAWLAKYDNLSIVEIQQVLQLVIKEVLWEVLGLSRGEFELHWKESLKPILGTWEIDPLLLEIGKQLQEWYQIYPRFRDPEQCPMIVSAIDLQNEIGKSYYNLALIANGDNSISRISRYLHRDIVSVAKSIYPYVKKGWIKLLPSVNTMALPGKSSYELLKNKTTHIERDYIYN